VVINAARNGGGSNNIGARIRVGSTTYSEPSTYTPGNGNFGTADRTISGSVPDNINPATTAAWTVADINGTGSNPLNGIGVFSTDANPTLSLSSIQLLVTYTPAATTHNVTLALSCTGTATLAPTLKQALSRTAVFQGAGSLSAAGVLALVLDRAVTFSGVGALAAVPRLATIFSSVTLAGGGGVSFASTVTKARTLSLASGSSLSAERSHRVAFGGSSGLTASSQMTFGRNLVLAGAGTLSASWSLNDVSVDSEYYVSLRSRERSRDRD
jgi:hypothetical protein